MIKPLFPFYGSKWRDARRYPGPQHELVIEPLAGSAGYSLWHEPAKVRLYDIDPIIVGVWQYLIAATPAEILALPDLDVGQSVDDLALPQEARWLIGFWLNRGSAQPKKTKTAYSARTERQQLIWSARARDRIADAVPLIRHWTVEQASYEDIPTPPATYFIDAPYVQKGRYYRFADMNYEHLAAWVQGLPGLSITCEQDGATWLPFNRLASIKSTRGRSEEVVYIEGETNA